MTQVSFFSNFGSTNSIYVYLCSFQGGSVPLHSSFFHIRSPFICIFILFKEEVFRITQASQRHLAPEMEEMLPWARSDFIHEAEMKNGEFIGTSNHPNHPNHQVLRVKYKFLSLTPF